MPPRRPTKGGRAQQTRAQNSDTVNSNIRVVVRIRPQNAREREAENSRVVVCPVDEKILTFDPKVEESPSYFRGRKMRRRNVMQRKSRDIQFAFDHIFHEACSQEYVYEHTTKSIVDSILSGYNCSVFAYGATGAGKTFTMLGGPDQPGVMFLTVMELYHKIASQQADKLCDVAVSYLEIYNETVKDLLVPTGPLAIREDPQRGVVVSGLSLHKPKSAKELFSMLEYGNTNRTQHPTDANAQSSRSHAVFQVFVRQRDRTAGISTNVRVAKMSLIDLAGSERATVTTNRGARFREGANINRSLLALGNCINALADNKNKGKHIPYRNSKLTRLLKDSLGGNCKTVMIAAVSPSSLTYEDTYNTLRYADRAKEIKSTLQKNVVNIDMHISRYTQIIAELRAEVVELKGRLQKQVAVPTATMQQPTTPAPEPEYVVNLRLELNKVFQQRSSIRKELLELESFDRDLTAKISRKNLLVERLRLIHGDTVLGDKTTSKMERVVAASTARQNRVRSRKVGVEQRMRENQETLERLVENAQKASPEGALPEAIQDTLRMRHLEIEIKDGRRQAKHLRKFARHQESHIKSSEKLILRLLTVVRSQYFLIKGSGIATSDLTNKFEGIQKQVANEREVMWADQSQTEGSLTLEDAETEDFNRLLNLPILSCVQITPSGQRRATKTPSPQQHQQQNNGNTPYQPVPSRRLSYATACQTMVGITPTATGGAFRIPGFESQPSYGQPQRIPTPNRKQNHTSQRVATPQRSTTNPAEPAQSVPQPTGDKSSLQQRLVTHDVDTLPENPPSVMPLHRIEGIQSPAVAMEQSTLSTDPSGRVLPSSVERGVDSPASPQLAKDNQQDFQVDGISPLQATPLNETTPAQMEQSENVSTASPVSLASPAQVPGVTVGEVEENTSKPAILEGQSQVTETTPVARVISFDENRQLSSKPAVSPVTACKLTYAQVASSPVVSQPARVPFANISVNSPVIQRAPSPVKKAPALNQSFTICKGVPEENFRQDVQQRKPSRRDTFSARPRSSLHHQRSRSQGHLNVESRPTSNVRTQHADTLRKYGLPSMTDNTSGGPSKPVPAYMSMTKAAAGKRRGNYGEGRPLPQSTKENVPPANRGRPLFSTGPSSMKGNINNSNNNNRGNNLARSFSVGNIRQASRSMSNNKSHSTWNF